MTRNDIQNRMVELIQITIKESVNDIIMDYIDEDAILEFMWSKDYGRDFVEDYIENNKDELIEEALEEIYGEIDIYDITEPWM